MQCRSAAEAAFDRLEKQALSSVVFFFFLTYIYLLFIYLFRGKVCPTPSHSILHRNTVALVCNYFESYAAGDPVTAVGWFQLLGVPTERKEIANTMSSYLISSLPPVCMCVRVLFFLKNNSLIICSY